MCLAIPTRVVELLPDNQALVDLGGVRKAISSSWWTRSRWVIT
jgi:hydrogenase expression/formation protein HypC